MKWLIRAFISISILAVLGSGGLVLYNVAYAYGDAAGYGEGYYAGHTVGQGAGYASGHTDGYQLGKQKGYDAGYLSGEADGYEEGNKAGYEAGVEEGLGHGYTIEDPTYQQVLRFLVEDMTDKNKFVEDIYVCTHFTRDVCNNAEAEGIRCAYVGLVYPEGGHAIVAFNTVDAGLVYFEPQSDGVVKPVLGRRYYKCVEPEPGYRYTRPSYDDTIMDILVIW